MKRTNSTRRVNAGRFRHLTDPHRKSDGDPDEATPDCSTCGSANTFWCIDQKATAPVLCCRDCPQLPDFFHKQDTAVEPKPSTLEAAYPTDSPQWMRGRREGSPEVRRVFAFSSGETWRDGRPPRNRTGNKSSSSLTHSC
jgi:hypothetical protein